MFETFFDDLGFETTYTLDRTLEYPPDGEWGLPEVVVKGRRLHADPAPRAIVRPRESAPFLLSDTFVSGVEFYGSPDPRMLCAFSQFGTAVLLDTEEPHASIDLPVYATAVAAATDENLLLFAEFTRVIAVGPLGVVWTSEEVFTDDLHIRRSDNGRIVCRGYRYYEDKTSEITLDAATGHLIG